jgi:lysophospholipase L1-like esterase
LAIRQCRTCPALDLTDAQEVEFIFKRTATTLDDSALFTKRLTTGGIVAADLALGLVDVVIDDSDTSPADGYSDWVWITRVTLDDGTVLQPFGLSGAARLDAVAPSVDGIIAADSTTGTIAPVALTPAPLPAYATVAYVDAEITDHNADIAAHGQTVAGRALLTAANAAAQRTALALGTAAVANTGTSAGNMVVLDGSARLPAVDGRNLTNLPASGGIARVVSANTTAANDERLNVVASATITDPSPVEGKGYSVAVVNGTATVGGTGYSTAGTIIERVFHSGSWRTEVYLDSTQVIPASEKGAANGVAPLVGGLVPAENLPASASAPVLDPAKYLGVWVPATNTPTVPAAGAGNSGSWYLVETAGTATGNAAGTYAAGDAVLSNGTAWLRQPSPSVVSAAMLDAVDFGKTGSLSGLQVSAPELASNSQIGSQTCWNALETVTEAGYLTRASVRLTGTGSGRTVQFYVLRPAGGNFVCQWASPAVAADGNNALVSYSPAEYEVRVQAGDMIAARASANAIGLQFTRPGNTARSISGGALVAGTSYASTSTFADSTFAVGFEVEPAAVLPVGRKFEAGSVPRLAENGAINTKNLPDNLGRREASVRASASTEIVTQGSSFAVQKSPFTREIYAVGGSEFSASLGNIAGQVCIAYNTASPGFSNAGTLRTVRLRPLLSNSPGNVIHCWVVRPTNLATGRFTVVHRVGSILAETAGQQIEFRNLCLPVQAGDMLAFLGTLTLQIAAAGIPGAASHFKPAVTWGAVSLDAPQSLFFTPTTANNQPCPHDAEIQVGSAVDADWSHLVDFRNPWLGKKIIFVGTSITQGGNSTAARRRYVNLVASALYGSTVVNEGASSTGISFNTFNALSKTGAELGVNASQSYETKIIGQAADLLVIDHGFNDRLQTVGVATSTNRAEVCGAFNHVINAYLTDRPGGRVALITPPTRWAVDGANQAQLEAVAAGIVAVGARWNAPVLDLTMRGPFGPTNTNVFFPDKVHPGDEAHAIIANLVAKFLLSQV